MKAAVFLFVAFLHGACETKAEKGICSCRLQKTSLLPNKINAVLITKNNFFIMVVFFTLFKAGFLPKQRNEN